MIEIAESQFWAYKTDENDNQKDLALLDNVKFIYELSLAELEPKTLNVNFEVTNGLKDFKILNKSDEQKELIKRKGSYYKTVDGQLSDYFKIIKKSNSFYKSIFNSLDLPI